MKSPLLYPAIFLVIGILGLILIPRASAHNIPGVLCAIGMIWLAYVVIITGVRRKT